MAGRRTPAHQPPRCALRDVSRSGRSMPVVPRHDRGRGGPPRLRSFPGLFPHGRARGSSGTARGGTTPGPHTWPASARPLCRTSQSGQGNPKRGPRFTQMIRGPATAMPPDLTGRACWTLGRPTGPAPQRVMGGCSGRVVGALAEPAARTQSIDLCGCRARLRGHLHPHHLTAGGIPALPGSHGTGQAWPSVSRRQPRAGSTDSPASVAVRWAAGR